MKNVVVKLLLVAGILSATVESTLSQGTFYTSRSAFEATLIASTTVTFEDVPPTLRPLGEWSVSASGVIFTNPAPFLYVTDPGGRAHPIPGTGRYIWNFDGGAPISVLLPGGVTAFGADFSGGIEPHPTFNATLTVNLAGGGSYAYNFSGDRGSWIFYGVTFPQSISSVIFNDGGSFLHEEMLDNVTFGTIPEPSTLGLFTLGSLLLGWRLRRRFYPRRCPPNLPVV
jgi:hypothetical protein